MAAEVVYHVVTVLLVLIFSLASAIKLVPHLIDDRYSREIVSRYLFFSEATPYLRRACVLAVRSCR